MRRWLDFSARRTDASAGLALWLVGVVVGLASEGAAFGWDEFSRWIPDLAVGLVFVGCGAHARARNRGTAALLAAAGFTWFAANFWSDALFVHPAVLRAECATRPGPSVCRRPLRQACGAGGDPSAVPVALPFTVAHDQGDRERRRVWGVPPPSDSWVQSFSGVPRSAAQILPARERDGAQIAASRGNLVPQLEDRGAADVLAHPGP